MTSSNNDRQYSQILVEKRRSWLARQRRARLEIPLAAAELAARKPRHVLDLGCADGILWPELQPSVDRIVGVNYDDWLTQQCKKRFPSGLVLRADATQLPFESNSFDLCICLEVFNYLSREGRPKGLREIVRVLRPGGRLVLTSPLDVGLPGLIKFAGRVATGACWPNVAAHWHMLWRRVFYKLVDLKEEQRICTFHYNAWELVEPLRDCTNIIRVKPIPMFYPLVTTLMIVADKPA